MEEKTARSYLERKSQASEKTYDRYTSDSKR